MRKHRVGKNMLLEAEKWVEFDTFPAGKKLALSVHDIAGISEGPKGEAIILVDNGQGRTPVQLLNLYGPALREILLLRGYRRVPAHLDDVLAALREESIPVEDVNESIT